MTKGFLLGLVLGALLLGALAHGQDTYILDDDGNPVVEKNKQTWAEWVADNATVVFDDAIRLPPIRVRTVFLGVPRPRPSPLPPALFATRVTGGPASGQTRLWANRAAALAGHAQIVADVKAAVGAP